MKTRNFPDLINDLQNKPYNTRVKILWGTIIVVAIILFILWILGLKSTIGDLNKADLTRSDTAKVASATQVSVGAVERIESGSNLKIYFNFTNPTDDILNISRIEDISLTVRGKSVAPTGLTDRQGKPFVQKILSHTQNFGILVFPKTDLDLGQLIFNQIFFEQSPDQMLSQEIDLDLKKLEKSNKLRN